MDTGRRCGHGNEKTHYIFAIVVVGILVILLTNKSGNKKFKQNKNTSPQKGKTKYCKNKFRKKQC